jgi:hypothetical protein
LTANGQALAPEQVPRGSDVCRQRSAQNNNGSMPSLEQNSIHYTFDDPTSSILSRIEPSWTSSPVREKKTIFCHRPLSLSRMSKQLQQGRKQPALSSSSVAKRRTTTKTVMLACMLAPLRGAAAFGVARRPASTLAFSSAGKTTVGRNRAAGGFADTPRSHPLVFSASLSTEATTSASKNSPVRPYDQENIEAGLGSYAPLEFESKIYQWWESSGCFQPDAKPSKDGKGDGKKPYVLPMPPPNVTGRLHMGHAIFVALQDILARFHRMRGRPVLWLPGELPLSGLCIHTENNTKNMS